MTSAGDDFIEKADELRGTCGLHLGLDCVGRFKMDGDEVCLRRFGLHDLLMSGFMMAFQTAQVLLLVEWETKGL